MTAPEGVRRWSRSFVFYLISFSLAFWAFIWFFYLCPPDTGVLETIAGGVLPALLPWSVIWLFILEPVQTRKRSAEFYGTAWHEVCLFLEAEHQHNGNSLKGTWRGRPFHAAANDVYIANGIYNRYYYLSMPVETTRAEWRFEPLGRGVFGGEMPNWVIRTDDPRIEQQLGPALLPAIQEAEQHAKHYRDGAKLSYSPRAGVVSYGDDSGSVPCAHDFLVHLQLVHCAAAISDAWEPFEVDTGTPPGRLRVWLRYTEAPTWVHWLWFPGAIAGLIGLDRSLWFSALLPVALAMPYVWKVRIGRQ